MRRSGIGGAAFRALALGAGILVLASCTYFRISEDPFVDREAFQNSPPRTVAILPFTNASSVDNAAETARVAMLSALSRLSYDDVELDRVDSALSALALEHGMAPEELPPPLIRKAEIGDALLSGEVLSVHKLWLPFYSHIKIRMRLTLTDARTGATIYRNEARGLNQKLETPFSITGILTGAFQTLWHLREDEMRETFEEFAQRISAEMPDPGGSTLSGKYYIRDVQLEFPRDPLRAGDKIGLQFHGTPSQRASFDLGAIKKDIPMTEIQPGRYGVSYTIEPGQIAEYCIVTCKLATAEGDVRVPLYQQRFKVDARIPGSTRIEGYQMLENSVVLRAAAVSGSDVVAYHFYRSEDSRGPFHEVGRTLVREYEDKDIEANRTYYYTVTAEDTAGNISKPPAATSLQIPGRGPTTLSGVIRKDMILQPFSGPYTISGSLLVAPGVKLIVQPGVTMNFGHDTRLEAQGALVMVGATAQPIVCRAAADEWAGIALTGQENHVMEHVKIQRAVQAVELRAGNLLARNLEIENAKVGVASFTNTQLRLRNCAFKFLDLGVDSRSAPTLIEGCQFNTRQTAVIIHQPGASIRGSNFPGSGLAIKNRSGVELLLDRNYLGPFDPLDLLGRYEGLCRFEQLYDKPYPEGSLTQVFPESSTVLVERGRRLDTAGDFRKAAEALAMALTKEPNPDVFRRVIILLRDTGQLPHALRVGQSAVASYPNDQAILLACAETLLRAGQAEDGRKLLAELEKDSPDDPRIRALREKYP